MLSKAERKKLSKHKEELISKFFKVLYSYPKIQSKYYLGDTTNGRKVFTYFNNPFFGLTKEKDYCQKSDSYFLKNRKSYFEDAFFYTNYASNNLIRTKVINIIGDEAEPRSSLDMPQDLKKTQRYPLPPKTQIFFTRTMMHIFQELGKTFGCFFQMYNVIPGHAALTRKDFFVNTIK